MEADEIERRAKRIKLPDQGTYKPSYSYVEARAVGCFNLKDERTGYLEEASVIGKNSPPYLDKKYSLVEPSLRPNLMRKPAPEKPVKKTSLSPCSYEALEVFKNTQVRKHKVYISKYKNENFLAMTVRLNKWKLGPGTHEVDKGKHVVTKGLAKGWK